MALIDLRKLCEANSWHEASCIDALVKAGESRKDAEAFIDYMFTYRAYHENEDTNSYPEDCVTNEQWSRLQIQNGDDWMLESKTQ